MNKKIKYIIIKYIIFVIVLLFVTSGCGCSKGGNINIDINKTKEVNLENLKLNIPEVFVEDNNVNSEDYDNINKYYLVVNEKSNDQCNITISNKKDNGKSLDDLIDHVLGYDYDEDLDNEYEEEQEENSYKKININNIEWVYHKFNDDINMSHYVYTSRKNGKVYIIVYNNISKNDICDKAFDKILNSFNFN